MPDGSQEIERYQHYAQAQVNALETVSIELPVSDLQVLQKVANHAGISVSQLVVTVLHQFVASHQE